MVQQHNAEKIYFISIIKITKYQNILLYLMSEYLMSEYLILIKFMSRMSLDNCRTQLVAPKVNITDANTCMRLSASTNWR